MKYIITGHKVQVITYDTFMQNKLHTKKAHSGTEKLGSSGPLCQRPALTPCRQFCKYLWVPRLGLWQGTPECAGHTRSYRGHEHLE